MGQGDFLDFRPQFLVFFRGQQDLFLDLRIRAFPEEFLRQADAQAFDILAQGFREIRHVHRQGRGIVGVDTTDGVQDEGGVGHVARQRPDLVQGRREGDAAIPGYAAVRRFDADDAVEGRRLADGSARIGAQGPNGFPGRHGRGAAAG